MPEERHRYEGDVAPKEAVEVGQCRFIFIARTPSPEGQTNTSTGPVFWGQDNWATRYVISWRLSNSLEDSAVLTSRNQSDQGSGLRARARNSVGVQW